MGAATVLSAYAEKQRAREEQERLAKEQVERERQAKAQAEADRQAAIKAEQDRIAQERAEAERQAALKAEADRQAAIKAEQDRIAQERAEAERQAALKAEADRLAVLKAEQDRIAQERAEAERQAALKAEADRQAALKAEQDRIAQERAEAERQTALKAEADRLAALKAEQDRIAKERAEAERQAALKAEQDQAREEIGDTAKRPAVSALRLMVQSGPNTGQVFTLKSGINIIGRSAGVSIHLTDGLISRQHVRLNVEAKRVTLEDLGSANGTFVNAQKIGGASPITLKPGDLIAVGDTVLIVQAATVKPLEATVEPLSQAADTQSTLIADTPRPKPMAGHSTDLPAAIHDQQRDEIRARLKTIAAPTMISAAGFGLISAVVARPEVLGTVESAFGSLTLLMSVSWLTINIALRRMGISVSWRRIMAVIVGWLVASGLGLGAIIFLSQALNASGIGVDNLTFAFVLTGVFGIIVGTLGGQATARILQPVIPALRVRPTTVGWTIAWVAGLAVLVFLVMSQRW